MHREGRGFESLLAPPNQALGPVRQRDGANLNDPAYMLLWRNGIRAGLRNQCPQGRQSSNLWGSTNVGLWLNGKGGCLKSSDISRFESEEADQSFVPASSWERGGLQIRQL